MRTIREREVKRTLFTQEVRENVANHLKIRKNGKATSINGNLTGTDGSTTADIQRSESTYENYSWHRANGSHSRDRSEANSHSQISDDDTFTSPLQENLNLRSSTPINSGESDVLRNGSPPRDIVAFYRRFGDWYNIFPKTDYTYSKRSPWFGKEVAPGIPMIPNLSRPSLHGGSSISERSFMNTNSSSSIQNSRNSEKSYRENNANRSLHDIRKSERTYWETIVKTTTMTVTTTVTTITTYASNAVTKMHDSRTFLPLFLLLACALISYLLLFTKTEKDGLNLGDTSISHVIAPYTKIFEYISSFFTSTFYLLYETISMLPVFVYQTFFGVTTFLLPESPNTQKPLINQKVENVLSSHEFKIEDIRNLILQTQTTDKEYIRQVVSEVVSEILSQKGYSDRHSLDELKQSFEGKLNFIQEKIETQVPSSSAEIQTKDPNSAALSTAVLRQEIQEIVEGAINKYHADQTGMPDFALSSFGGQILKTKCTNNYLKQRGVWTIFGYSIADVYNSPDVIIKPGTLPGECWAFEGSAGCVVIKLAMPIIVNAVTMEHTPKELTHYGQIKSAPKLFSVSSLKDENDEEPDLLGRFTFLDNHKSLQTFQTKISEPTEIIELKVESNHGNPDYTCLYRFRVHGSPVNA